MKTYNAVNPYDAPQTTPLDSAGIVYANGQLDYRRSITYVFDNPDWVTNIFGVVLCTLVGSVIPILPVMVLVGYQFEIIERLARNPRETYPSFRFDQIMQYLSRGLYPMIVAILASIVAIPFLLLVIAGPLAVMGLLIAAVGDDGAAVVVLIAVPIIVCSAVAAGIAANIIMLPMILRAGLAQDIGAAFDLAFVKDFVRKMWKDVMKAGLFWIAAAIVAQLVGALLFCVGSFFTVAVVQLAQAHLGMQLYQIYLARGGEKIPRLNSHPWESTPHPASP